MTYLLFIGLTIDRQDFIEDDELSLTSSGNTHRGKQYIYHTEKKEKDEQDDEDKRRTILELVNKINKMLFEWIVNIAITSCLIG
jgi:hypothetical protein